MSQEFSPAGIITMALHSCVSSGGWTIGPLVATVLRRKSHLMNLNNQSTRDLTLLILKPTFDITLNFLLFFKISVFWNLQYQSNNIQHSKSNVCVIYVFVYLCAPHFKW
jgi:hypothetical protein